MKGDVRHGVFEAVKEELHASLAHKLVFVEGAEWYDKHVLIACDIKNGPAIRNLFVVVLTQHDC